MNNRVTTILISLLLLAACSRENSPVDEPEPEQIMMKLSVTTRAIGDPASINQDQTFSSLAIYIYDNDPAATLVQSVLLPSFSPASSKDIAIRLQPGVKLLFLIANYAGKTLRSANGSPYTLSGSTTKQELENLITESNGTFPSTSLLMVGKQTLTITPATDGTQLNVNLRRLQARVDVHAYKGPNFSSSTVNLEYIKLHNQVLNSEIKFDYTVAASHMLNPPLFNEQTVNTNASLSTYTPGTILQPVNAKAIFYSYQNLVTIQPPTQATTPWLEIKLNVNGVGYTYKGYITDNNQVANKYSLLQNNVYQVIAILDTDKKITLSLNILPWNQQNIEYERPVTANDFSFGPWGNSWGGINAKTMNTNVGGLEDAVFQFELKAPFGASWCATLTNGLDFTFTSSTSGLSSQAVSTGYAIPGSPAVIAVRATKRWTGDSRDTEFYITVEGKEIAINPVVGTQRRYPGTDTRIKIIQVASYN